MAEAAGLAQSVKVVFTPIYGVLSDSPVCYILEVDNTCILLDCGWREPFDAAAIQGLRP